MALTLTLSRREMGPTYCTLRIASKRPLPSLPDRRGSDMSNARKKSQDQRQSYRIPVTTVRRGCELTVGDQTLSARLLDQSAGGFAVLVDRLAGLDVDHMAQLATDSGSYSVRVVHIAELPGADSLSGGVKTIYRLGLSREGEAIPDLQPSTRWFAPSLLFRSGPSNPSGGLMLVLGGLLAVGAVAVALWLTGTGWSVDSLVDPNAMDSGPSIRSYFQNDGRATKQPARSSKRSEPLQDESFRRLPGATAMTLPAVADRLELSDAQREKIQTLIDETAEAIRDLGQQSRGLPRGEIARQRAELLDRSRQEALKQLNEQQRAAWEELMNPPQP